MKDLANLIDGHLQPAAGGRWLDVFEAELLGQGDTQPEAVALRRELAVRGMPPRHAIDVLKAFRMDVTKLRY